MNTAREAMPRDLRRLREGARGDVLRYRLTFRCTTLDCGAEVITIYVVEEPGRKKFQPPNFCNRCRVELLQLVQKVFVQERIEIAQDLALRPMLRQELLNLQETIREATRRLAIDQADERIHDDLAMSLALAIWSGEHPPWVVRTQRLIGF